MKPFKLGTYQMGWRLVDIYIDPDETGGWFNLCPDGNQHALMHIGVKYVDFIDAYVVLCHELSEAIMQDVGVVYKELSFNDDATDAYHFCYSHKEHNEITARLAYCLGSVSQDFQKAYNKCRKGRKL